MLPFNLAFFLKYGYKLYGADFTCSENTIHSKKKYLRMRVSIFPICVLKWEDVLKGQLNVQ